MRLFGKKKIHVLEHDFVFASKRFSEMMYDGAWIELRGSMCKIRQGATDNGATLARDENAVIAWSFHDNAYDDKFLPLTRLQKDLIMYDLLKKEGFRWFRYRWIKKIFKNYNGINTIWIYFLIIILFGWMFHVK